MLLAINHRLSLIKLSRMLAAIVLALTTANLATAAEFIPLGTLPGDERSWGVGISADGSVVTGRSYASRSYGVFRWSDSEGMEDLGVLPGYERMSMETSSSISADGSTIVGYAYTNGVGHEGFIHTESEGWRGLGDGTQAFGVSPDGSVAVGYFRSDDTSTGVPDTEAFRWTEQGGAVRLGFLDGDDHSLATDVTHDGSVVVGESWPGGYGSGREAFIWTESTGMQGTGIETGGLYDLRISPDGSILAGTLAPTPDTPEEAFYWTEQTGVVRLGLLPLPGSEDEASASNLFDLTPDGRLFVGWREYYGDPQRDQRAFVWSKANGMEDFQTVLTEELGLGPALAGWQLLYLAGVSSNGQSFTGFGTNPDGQLEAYVVRLDAPWRIPEPTTTALSLLALVPIAVWRNRRTAT